MTHGRKIPRTPPERLFYLLDANFLANVFIPYARVTNVREQDRVLRSQDWWVEISAQLKRGSGRVFVPDVCIAEAFKVLAKKYYEDRYFRNPAEYKLARDGLRRFLHTPAAILKSADRRIQVHDLSTSRDIIIAVDRFYEIFAKHRLSASIIDLIILATAKYLIDFFNIPPSRLIIVTLDNSLWRGTRKLTDIPTAFNPNSPGENASKVFV